MFETRYYTCPNCRAEIHGKLEDGAETTCRYCSVRFKVLLDEETGRIGLVEVGVKELGEPLFLPKGSIRALVTILAAAASWIMFVAGKDVPGCLLGLLLTVIGYYFALRQRMAAAESRIFDISVRKQAPLFLPAGFIRFLLILGFLIGAGLLYKRGRLLDAQYLEFFVILLGLVLGYGFSKVFGSLRKSTFYALLNHIKGALVLCAAVCLFAVVITGKSNGSREYIALLLCCAISFYFGSRS
ncbi:MAG: hypothetical protein ACYTBJ_12460 [Planctomycetota bacterium]|jgi:DNA-directed RNA polymerase subunit RPC12/RpoP